MTAVPFTPKEFTVEQGIKVQTEQLDRWSEVLKPEVLEELRAFAVKDNDKAKNGYGITRGTDLDNFIANYRYNKSKKV